MKYFTICIILFFSLFSESLFSQNPEIDSLKIVLKNTKTDTAKARVYCLMSELCELEDILKFTNECFSILDKLEKEASSKDLKSLYMKYRASCYLNNGYYYDYAGQIKASLESYSQALKINEDLKNDFEIARVLNNIGGVYSNASDFKNAIVYYNKALAIREKIKDQKGIAMLYSNIGEVYNRIGDVKLAIFNFEKSISIVEKINDEVGLANALNNIGGIYLSQGNHDKALKSQEKALAIFIKLNDKRNIAYTYTSIGMIYINMAEINNAIQCSLKALAIKESLNDKEGMASSLNNIASIYYNVGDIPKALEYFHKSLKLKEQFEDKRGLGLAYNNMALLYFSQNDLIKAHEYLNKSLIIAQKTGNKKDEAYSLHNFASFYREKGDPLCSSSNALCKKSSLIKAIGFSKKSLTIYQSIDEKNGVVNSLNLIGVINYDLKNYDSSLVYFEKGLDANKEGGYKEGFISSLVNAGGVYLIKNRVPEAYDLVKQGFDLAIKIGYPEYIKNSSKLLSEIYSKQNNGSKALEMYKLYIQMRDSLNNISTQKAAISQAAKYSYEKKVAEDNARAAEEKKVIDAQFKQERTQRYALYGGLGLVIVFGLFVFNRLKVTQKQKKIIELKEVETQNQKHIIEEKHKEITDSINYAERIQRSFLATDGLLNENLKNYFVLFKPKDVVSGDFYWGTKLSNDNFALVTADSTGHGVPGAIMSILNISALEKAVELGYSNPSEILNNTRKTIIERLKKDGSPEGGKDGMDCSLICFDFNNKKFYYSSANNPIWVIRTNELIELTGDKMPVGKHDKESLSFTQNEFELLDGDLVYTLTDGLPDQFGGPKGKKFMYKKLKEMLISISHKDMAEQKKILETELDLWKGNLEQVDDITIIGVRI